MMGLAPSPSPVSVPQGHPEKVAQGKPGRRSSPGTECAGSMTLDLDTPSPCERHM